MSLTSTSARFSGAISRQGERGSAKKRPSAASETSLTSLAKAATFLEATASVSMALIATFLIALRAGPFVSRTSRLKLSNRSLCIATARSRRSALMKAVS